MTREELIQEVGIEYVLMLENEACEPTSRLIYPAFEAEHAGMVEYVASIGTEHGIISAYYYQKEEDVTNCEDVSYLDWTIERYELN